MGLCVRMSTCVCVVRDVLSLYFIQPGHIEFYLDGVRVAEHTFGIGAVASGRVAAFTLAGRNDPAGALAQGVCVCEKEIEKERESERGVCVCVCVCVCE